MDIDITYQPSPTLRDLLAKGREMPRLAVEAAGKALAVAGPVIVGHAVQHRFTGLKGPFPVSEHKLGRISGRLRQSITSSRPQLDFATGTAAVRFGSNVSYFKIHEFGFSGPVNVRAHTRRGRPVRAHQRAVNIKARAPMTTELQHPRTVDVVTSEFERALRTVFS